MPPANQRAQRGRRVASGLLGLLWGCAGVEAPAPVPAVEDGLPRSTDAVASYTLRAELDAATHAIRGSGQIHWVNTSARPVEELYLHLYLNAFEGAHTLFFRKPSRRARGGALPQNWG